MNTFVQEIASGIATGDSGVMLPAALTVPKRAKGIVLLAHDSGGSLNSPQDLDVATVLQNARFATLRLDLLDEHEARNPHNVFDTELLAERIVSAANWVGSHAAVRSLPLGYLSIEHTPGNIPCGEGGGDYAPGGLMTTYDTMLGEYHTFHEDSYWQIAGRMLDVYHRPADQPAGDDPNPPKYLGPDSPRGPYFYVVFEPTTAGVYEWCRGRTTIAAMQQEDAYIRATGATLTGYPVIW